MYIGLEYHSDNQQVSIYQY